MIKKPKNRNYTLLLFVFVAVLLTSCHKFFLCECSVNGVETETRRAHTGDIEKAKQGCKEIEESMTSTACHIIN